MSIAAPEPTSPLPTQEPRSILPIVAQLFTLLQAASAPTPPSLNLTDDAALARNREVDAVAQTLRTQLAEAERYARELPGGDVREEEVEKVIRVLERRVEDGRCASLAFAPWTD